jgi:hypothetical protein
MFSRLRDAAGRARLNWQAIGAIGELIGAIAVVVTLLYISKDIRQNSRSLAIAALRDTTSNWNDLSGMLASSADLADIVVRGNRAIVGLSEAEALRYGAYVQSFFDNVENIRSLVVDYKIDRDMSVLEAIVARRVCIHGYADWWRENTDDYSPAFVAWIERIRTRS